jgi:N-methylhydantoinase B
VTVGQLDPITVEIIRNGFITAAEDMNAGLIRSAYTPVIYESRDCAVALIDVHHRVLGQSTGIPLFLGNLEACTRITEEMHGQRIWQEGDIWIVNDAYLTGTHLHDVTVFAPIFHSGRLQGFAASRAHWLDIGAKDPGVPMNATEIYQEGLRLGPTKIVKGGEPCADVIDIIARNVRFPQSAIGDLHAQFAVASIGKQRLSVLLDRYGSAMLEAAAEEIFAQNERLDRSAVQAIPDGEYFAEGCLDNDGIDDTPYWIRVSVRIQGDRMVVDLTDCSDAARGPLNCGETQTISACRVAFKYLINPDQPVNGGSFRPLEIRVRPGSILGAREPVPCQFYFTPLGLLIDLFGKALSPTLEKIAVAANYGDAMIMQFSGTDPRTGGRFLENEPHAGGWAASSGRDGQDGMIWLVSGNFRDTPIEIFESKFPARITRYGFRPDTGGPGQWRGGCGIIREYVMETADAELSLWFDRSVTTAWGLFGGGAAAGPDVVINPGAPDERHLLKASRIPLRPGDVVRCLTGGGGGFGDPRSRDRSLLDDDIADGFVSFGQATVCYGWKGGDPREVPEG